MKPDPVMQGFYADPTIKKLEARIEELEERQKWIDEVARPTHPDDERPWCAAYLDCREKIKELEDLIIHQTDYIKLLTDELDEVCVTEKVQFEEKIKELKKFIKENYPSDHFDLALKVKNLEKGIEKFIDWLMGATKYERIEEIPDEIWIPFTKLIEKEKP